MPHTRPHTFEQPTSGPPQPSIQGTRVDPPHVMGDPVVQAADPEAELELLDEAELSDEAISPPESEFPLLRAQAEQIGAYLRKRQRDLDAREARLNSQLAEYENQVRGARAWFVDRRDELLERERHVAALEQQLQARQVELAPTEQELAQRFADLNAAEQAIQSRQEEIERHAAHADQEQDARREAAWLPIRRALAQIEERRQAVEAQILQVEEREQRLARRAAGPLPEELAREAELDARAKELDSRAKVLAEREGRLTEAERQLNHGQTQIAQLRQQLENERQRLDEQARTERRRQAEAQRAMEAELATRRESLERTSEQIDHRRAALAQSQAEVTDLHRETLEVRLATEELWTELSAVAPPATLASALAATRARLAEHYRLERGEIARQKVELAEVAASLSDQHAHLKAQTREFQDWLAARESELERQAAALVTREQELDREQTEQREAELQSRAQRFELEQEVRRLTAALRHAPGGLPGESRFAEV